MSQKSPLRILFVEDLPTDVMLAERELLKHGLAFESRRVDTETGLKDALRDFSPDTVISDYAMPAFDGLSALRVVKEFDPYLPFIILTGSMNEEVAVSCMKAGASDYVIKEHLSRLPFSIGESMERMKLILKTSVQETQLRQSEERYRCVFESSNAVMLIIDAEESSIVDANNAAVEYYGWPRAELIGKPISEINTLSPERLREQIRLALERKMNHFQFRHRHADGTETDVESRSSPITIGDRTYLFSLIHDISKRIKAERERDELSGKLSHYLATSPTITYAFRLQNGDMYLQWISENIASILGYTVQEALAKGWWFNNLASEDRAGALHGIAELTRLDCYAHEYRFMKKDRSTVWIRDEMRLMHSSADDDEVVGTLTDITGRKRSEAETALKSAALEAAGNAVVITDRDGTVEWSNLAFQTMTGYTAGEAIGKNPRELVKSGSQEPAVYRQLWDTIVSGKCWQGELVNKRKSGELYDEEMTITPVMDASRRIEHFIAVKNDITDRKREQKLLVASAREKEVLLREVHHRVKNNMQVISSLLNLSAENLDDAESCRIIAELHRRIEAMAIVHEQFYQAQDLSRIDFSVYLGELANSIIEEIGAEPGNPEIRYALEPLFLNLESAIPAGIVVSELVSNAVRFSRARPEDRSIVGVSLRIVAGTRAELEVRDNGPGFPDGFDAGTATSLGMRLIKILSEQLKGTVSMHNDGGAVAILRFNLPV